MKRQRRAAFIAGDDGPQSRDYGLIFRRWDGAGLEGFLARWCTACPFVTF
jgi:hypothetical protein